MEIDDGKRELKGIDEKGIMDIEVKEEWKDIDAKRELKKIAERNKEMKNSRLWNRLREC